MADVRLRRAYIELNARVGKYETALRGARRDNERFRGSLAKMQARMKRVNTQFNSTATGLQSIRNALGPIVALFSVNFLRSQIQDAAAYGANIRETAKGLGILHGELERVRFVFASDGIQARRTDKILRAILRRYQEGIRGNVQYREAFERLGFTVEDFANRGLTVLDILGKINQGIVSNNFTIAEQINLLDKIGSETARLAVKVFNEAGLEDRLRNIDISTTLDPQALKDLDQEFLNVSNSVTSFRNSLVSIFAPDIIAGIREIREGIRSIDVTEFANDIREGASALQVLVDAGKVLVGTFNDIRQAIPFSNTFIANAAAAGIEYKLLTRLIPRLPAPVAALGVATVAVFNAAKSIGQELNGYVPTLKEINDLTKTQAASYGEAERRVLLLLDSIQVVRERISQTPTGGHSARAYERLTSLLDTLFDEYQNALEVAQSLNEEIATGPVEVVQKALPQLELLRDRYQEIIDLASTPIDLQFTLREQRRLNQQIATPPILPNQADDFDKTTDSLFGLNNGIQDFLASLNETNRLVDAIGGKRLDLSLAQGEVTLQEYRDLRAEIEAIQSLEASGIEVTEDNRDLVAQRVALIKELLALSGELADINQSNNNANKQAVFLARRTAEAAAILTLRIRSARDFAIGLAQELAKAAIQALLIKPLTDAFSSFLSGVNIPGRQFGGPVSKGLPYIVGERGSEIFIPDRRGQIVPNSDISRLISSPSVNLEINAVDVNGVQRLIDQRLPQLVDQLQQVSRSAAYQDRLRESI